MHHHSEFLERERERINSRIVEEEPVEQYSPEVEEIL